MRPAILHLIPVLGGGGAERQLFLLSVEQGKRGARVFVGVRRGGEYERAMREQGVHVHFLGDHRSLSPLLLKNIRYLLRQLKPDIVQTWLPQMDVLGGFAARGSGTPWVMTERASGLAYSTGSAAIWLRRWLGSRADAIVCNSRTGVRYWQEQQVPDTRIRAVANALDIAAIRTAQPSSLDLGGAGRKLLLVVGRLHSQKAVDIVVRAVAAIEGGAAFKVLVLGDGPMREELGGLVRRLGVADRIEMRPYQPSWWGLLQAAHALISVSRYEGHPNVVLESLAAGCPVILSDIPEHREFVAQGAALWVPVDDPDALALMIRRVLAEGSEARERAELARKCVERLTIQASADAYEAIYEDLMGISSACAG